MNVIIHAHDFHFTKRLKKTCDFGFVWRSWVENCFSYLKLI